MDELERVDDLEAQIAALDDVMGQATGMAAAFGADYAAAFGADAPARNGLGQSAYEGLMLLAALANKAGSLDVVAMDAAAEGTVWSTPRGENTLTGRHMAQTIYLADGSGGSFNVVASFDNVASSEACPN